jgi:hypothetical protein
MALSQRKRSPAQVRQSEETAVAGLALRARPEPPKWGFVRGTRRRCLRTEPRLDTACCSVQSLPPTQCYLNTGQAVVASGRPVDEALATTRDAWFVQP